MLHRLRQTCRVCDSPKLTPVIDLGPQVLQGNFATGSGEGGGPASPEPALPMRLVLCEEGCGLLQTAASVPPERLYQAYWYRSGLNATMRDHLAGIVGEAMDLIAVETPTVLDIGCNDGTLLSGYPPGSARFGIDPSDVAAMAVAGTAAAGAAGNGITLIRSFFPSETALASLGGRRFDAVTSIAMFYDLEDPVAAARAVAGLLTRDGVWILELSYLPLMLLQNAFDTVCHEHLEYYSLAVLERIAVAAGLRIFRAAINGMNGGSIRCFACHGGNPRYGTPEDRAFLDALRERERGMGLNGPQPYRAFQARAEALRGELVGRLRAIRARGERIHVYGASTKGNVLLQWCGIDGTLVDCAADRNPAKVGTRTPGTGIPIRSEAESRALRPDWYLVLPWHFRHEFLERERATIAAGTKLLFPLPRIEVVDAETYDTALAGRQDFPALLGLAPPG
ncbi:class I SAM-dependent methyltransferase [Azospirillum soli]|uniref:class I SAM-dependent methyltransferase n=1 Tax=Azospirillum soli TaxID=1304799 RepID=UPI001AE397A8|nr:class I SAM-dependent methyltransferase [Azospirillum soli]MBP2316156.1 NDP-4-keto-2,6-dideoxyhexose 3-C-methyltransferase [Azospirillum soli]